eukprot:UN13502
MFFKICELVSLSYPSKFVLEGFIVMMKIIKYNFMLQKGAKIEMNMNIC